MAGATITRSAAVSAGRNRYFTGIPCKRGHTAERLVATGNCIECVALKDKERNGRPDRRAYFLEYSRRPEVRERMKPRDAERRRRERAKLGSRDWRHAIYRHAQARAEKLGLPFDGIAVLELLSNPPDRCPVFGMEFTPGGGRKRSTPSIDRIVPSLGYARGNIALISLHANRIKNSATVAEIRAVADWLESQVGVTNACEGT